MISVDMTPIPMPTRLGFKGKEQTDNIGGVEWPSVKIMPHRLQEWITINYSLECHKWTQMDTSKTRR